MLRVLGIILLFCFVLSHGSMGEAVPHTHDDQNSHSAYVSDHHDAADDSDDREPSTSPEVTWYHVHLLGDLAFTEPLLSAPMVSHSLTMRVAAEVPPRSLRIPPLLEPPSA